VRISRDRFWDEDAAAVATLRECLVAVSRLLAPAAPFASDWLHRALTGSSVHLAGWPGTSGQESAELATAMDAIRRLASLARAARESGKLKVRQPLGRMQVAVPVAVRSPTFVRLLAILQSEVNVKRIDIAESDTELVRLKGKANFRSLGKRYGKETPAVAKAVELLTPDHLRALETGSQVSRQVNGAEVVYFPEDVVVEREVATSWLVASDGPFVAALDPAIDADLAAEGLVRELVSHIQRLRREAGYDVSDRIALGIEAPQVVLAAAGAHREFIMTETLARHLDAGAGIAAADLRQAVDVDGHDVTFSLRRHGAGA
jgi:isoleucyl-tRNA synthetase